MSVPQNRTENNCNCCSTTLAGFDYLKNSLDTYNDNSTTDLSNVM